MNKLSLLRFTLLVYGLACNITIYTMTLLQDIQQDKMTLSIVIFVLSCIAILYVGVYGIVIKETK